MLKRIKRKANQSFEMMQHQKQKEKQNKTIIQNINKQNKKKTNGIIKHYFYYKCKHSKKYKINH